jgi:hypothetical protein
MEGLEPVPGSMYFLVAYLDRDLRVPKIETYFCIGRDPAENVWYFQEAESFMEKGSLTIEQATDSSECLGLQDEHVRDDLLDWGGLVKELAENKAMQDRGMTLAQRGAKP